eukprot:TRINITY_DN5503_c0_g1_i1.p1 TRINITY_DN5503_c0_g1~~TRINITY_DN5503_c0_g1_i1.p1  ORF type:complete len:117 (+),score=14.80 TRINITY_DN5503_c0_g1_i1:276-626(+)
MVWSGSATENARDGVGEAAGEGEEAPAEGPDDQLRYGHHDDATAPQPAEDAMVVELVAEARAAVGGLPEVEEDDVGGNDAGEGQTAGPHVEVHPDAHLLRPLGHHVNNLKLVVEEQ